jgi:hypothetical protein
MKVAYPLSFLSNRKSSESESESESYSGFFFFVLK